MSLVPRCQSLAFKNLAKTVDLTVMRQSSSVFSSVFSPAAGKYVWKMKPEDYDYVQEIARSAYADMLHDYDRNEKYEAGVKSAIAEIKRRGIEPRVLDIGTGTGLLSMMACRHGANDVVACEAFLPMAAIAEQIIKDNGFERKIRVVRKRSTEMSIEEDMGGKRANILVTEVFDTELIGEGAIATFRHALDHLLTPDCVVVPSLGRMYVQVVSSDLIRRWHEMCPLSIGDKRIDIPAVASHPAGSVFYDLQLTEVPRDAFTSLSGALKVFEFDFSGETRLMDNRHSAVDFVARADGDAHAVFMWWDLKMDVEGREWIDMAPNNVMSPTLASLSGCDHLGEGDDSRSVPPEVPRPWRDHWMQALYFLYGNKSLKRGQKATMLASHDDYSLAFDLSTASKDGNDITDASMKLPESLSPPFLSRAKLGFLNCVETREKLVKCLGNVVTSKSIVACVGEGSLLPIICAALGAQKVFVLDTNRWTTQFLTSIAQHNGLSSRIKIIGKSPEELVDADLDEEKVDVVVSDMWFQTLSLPWDGLYYSYALRSLQKFLEPDCVFLPRKGELKGMCLSMRDLWKIRAPVGDSAQGFDLAKFDAAILSACDDADPQVEPQPLWEYPNHALSKTRTLMTFDMDMFLDKGGCGGEVFDVDQRNAVDFQLWSSTTGEGEGQNLAERAFNGIAFWMDWVYDDDTVLSTGLSSQPEVGGPVSWNRNFKQGIYIHSKQDRPEAIRAKVVFHPNDGDISFYVNSVSGDGVST